jgi:hypothetical protein
MGDPTKAQYIEWGRQGGLKGGNARAKKLSAKQRQDIAKKAGRARWAKYRAALEFK